MAFVATAGEKIAGFTLVTNATSGIRFTNAVATQLLVQNRNFMLGSGVALGDYDGDDWPDIYFCAIDGSNRLYRNLGDWKFEDVTSASGLACANWHSTGACFADLDGDGHLDLLVSTLGRGVHCFMGDGHGGFREMTAEAGLTSNTGSMTMALADVDGDGDLDLYVANYGEMSILHSSQGRAPIKREGDKWVVTGPYGKRLTYIDGRIEEIGEPDALYLNDGKGHFRAVPWNSEFFLDEAGKPLPELWDFGLSAQMRDINDDGFPDIYVCNDFKTPDRFWLNDGCGHFRLAPPFALRHQSFASMGVDFADIDRDGRLDFMVVEMLSRENGRRIRSVSGAQLQPGAPGKFDDRPEVNQNTLFWNRGDGTYAEIARMSGVEASEWSWQPVFIDVDLDGFEDILIANGNAYDTQDRDTMARVMALGKTSPEQSRSNILLAPRLPTRMVAFHNKGNLTFEEKSASWGFGVNTVSQGIALADLDRDGALDVVVNCFDAPPLLYRNVSSAPRLAVRLRGRAPNLNGIGAKISVFAAGLPTQKQEIVAGGRYLSGDDMMRVFAAGSATNRLSVEVAWRGGARSLLTNLQPNLIYEIDEATAPLAAPPEPLAVSGPLFVDVSDRIHHTHFEDQYNDFDTQPLLPKRLSQAGPALAWFDVDHDGFDDLVVGSGKGGRLAVLLADSEGAFRDAIPTNAPVLPDDVVGFAGWAVADGRAVLLTALARYENPGLNAPVIALEWNVAAGPVGAGPVREITPGGGSTGAIAVTDMDGDGDLDVFVGGNCLAAGYPKAGPSRIFRHEQTGLVLDRDNSAIVQKVGLVNGAVWSDLNGDGFPDLILACEWGPVRVFISDRGRLRDATTQLGLAGFRGWWQGVTTGDFDGDGRMDIAAANWGLNGGVSASPKIPLRLYYGLAPGSTRIDLLESRYAPELGAEAPVRSLSDLVPAFAAFETFSSHEAFSSKTIPALLKLLPECEMAEATTLASAVFLNRGDHFEMAPLPSEAQFAPAFSVHVADCDGDGADDIFLSQNFFGTRADWTRCDGGRGLWLRGDGQGGFKPLPGDVSGVRAYGEQRGAALCDYNHDGRVDLALSQNGAQTMLYENSGAKPGLRVRLQGPPGNPSGYGAIVRLEFASGPGPAREIHAGSGYRSQDSATLVMARPTAPKAIYVAWSGGAKTRVELPADARDVVVTSQGQLLH